MKISEVALTYRTKIKNSERAKILSSEDIYKLRSVMFDNDTIEHREFFKILLLNQGNRVLGLFNASEGGVSGVDVDVRIIMQAAILANASSIILMHNHPSGNLKPSAQDDLATHKIKQAAGIMNMKVLDHMIFSSEGFYSYADNGRM
jgi:DNA repair protein RadC